MIPDTPFLSFHRKMALCHDLGSYAELAHMDTLCGGPVAAVDLLIGVAEANLPAFERKLQQMQMLLGEGAELQLWDREWAEHKLQQQGQTESLAAATEGMLTDRAHMLDLDEILDGLSAYLERCMGVRLRRVCAEAASPSMAPSIHCNDDSSGRAHTGSAYHLHIDRLMASLASQQPEATQGDSCSSPGEDRPPLVYMVHEEAAGVEGRPTGHWRPLGHLIVQPAAGGSGARFFAHGGSRHSGRSDETVDRGEGGHSVKADETVARSAGHLPVVLVGLNWPSGTEGGLDPLGASSAGLLELMHEMGHALHFLLVDGGGLACHPGGSQAAGSNDEAPGRTEPCPSSLPLEMLEVPSSLFELLAADSRVLSQILPHSLPREFLYCCSDEGKTKHAVLHAGSAVEALSRCIHSEVHCPLKRQIQVKYAVACLITSIVQRAYFVLLRTGNGIVPLHVVYPPTCWACSRLMAPPAIPADAHHAA